MKTTLLKLMLVPTLLAAALLAAPDATGAPPYRNTFYAQAGTNAEAATSTARRAA